MTAKTPDRDSTPPPLGPLAELVRIAERIEKQHASGVSHLTATRSLASAVLALGPVLVEWREALTEFDAERHNYSEQRKAGARLNAASNALAATLDGLTAEVAK